MLAVTDQAAAAIDGLLAARDLPDAAGIRLTCEQTDGTQVGIRLDLVEQPASGDEVLDGAPVYLDQEASTLLDDKLLDADVAGEEVRFAVRDQGGTL